MTINPKHKSQYVIPDRSCLVALSNSLTPIDIGGRRIFAISPARVLSKEESDEYHAWIDDDKNVRAVYQYYMDMDISNFSPYGDVPFTQAKKDLLDSNNRWADFGEYISDIRHIFRKNWNCDGCDWKSVSTWFNLKHFREHLAEDYCRSRAIPLSYKTNAEFSNILRGELGLDVDIKEKRKGWAWTNGTWLLTEAPQLCVNIAPII